MAVMYIEPSDLSATQAARVLDFLNRAASAQEIAARVEFPNERDIGVKLGQRLLDGRAALGGRYNSLEQVRAVKLIGPERFTELCVALLNLDPRNWIGQLGQLGELQNQLEDRQARLLAQLDALEKNAGQITLDIAISPQPAWLGQILEIRLHARDGRGRPLANQRVTLTASRGELFYFYGYRTQQGAAVEVRTGTDGSVRLQLRYNSAEGLTLDQQVALDEVLTSLDHAADSPYSLRQAFMHIADAYQDERRHRLRMALDIYAREWKSAYFDQINPSNLAFQWPIVGGLIQAFHHPGDGAACSAQAVAMIQWKNWVGAWFEFLGEYLSQQSGLPEAFAGAKARGAQGFGLVDDLVSEAHIFVAGQKGLAASWLSQRVVKFALHDFLGKDIADLDDETQATLFAHLDGAAEQLRPENRGTLAAINQSRGELLKKIDNVAAFDVALIDEIRGIGVDVKNNAARVAEDRGVVADLRNQVANDSATFGAQYVQFNLNFQQFSSQYQIFSASFPVFQENYSAFNVNYGQFKIDLGNITTTQTNLRKDLTTLQDQQTLNVKATAQLTSDVGLLKTDVTVVKGTLDTINTNKTGGG